MPHGGEPGQKRLGQVKNWSYKYTCEDFIRAPAAAADLRILPGSKLAAVRALSEALRWGKPSARRRDARHFFLSPRKPLSSATPPYSYASTSTVQLQPRAVDHGWTDRTRLLTSTDGDAMISIHSTTFGDETPCCCLRKVDFRDAMMYSKELYWVRHSWSSFYLSQYSLVTWVSSRRYRLSIDSLATCNMTYLQS